MSTQPAGPHRAEACPGEPDVIQEALRAIRTHLGMEIAYFSEFVDDRTVFRRVDAPGLEHLIKVGDSHSLGDVYCRHIIDGRLPELIPDTSRNEFARGMPITAAVPIGSHVSIPVILEDGTPYGMFCCLSPRANPSLDHRDLETMRVFAGIASKQAHSVSQAHRADQLARAAVQAIIADEDFDIVLQPIFDLDPIELASYEALTRFRMQPYRSPDRMFAEAARVGLGTELELCVLKAAISLLSRLPAHVTLSLNVAPETVASGAILELLPARNADRIIVELTEHEKVECYTSLLDSLAPLRARGVRIAVDDAGAGYSGLKHIAMIGPDIIKIDMSLTQSIHSDPARRALAGAMVFYAREMGALVVAEGIELREDLATLTSIGANRGQGYLLGRPQSVRAVEQASVHSSLNSRERLSVARRDRPVRSAVQGTPERRVTPRRF